MQTDSARRIYRLARSSQILTLRSQFIQLVNRTVTISIATVVDTSTTLHSCSQSSSVLFNVQCQLN